ncbi:hypothetical protein BC940DRAFT_331875 [Gongronella butleri]|nr:hypothetical protein BC940DRAFT_331875 [Gongronella butleri]
MPSHRRTQLRRENSFDHSLDSPSDSARIVSFGGREPSVSPINPARTPSMFSAHDQSLLASPSSRGVFQSPFAADSPLLGLDQSPSFNSARANDSIISKYHTRRLLFNEPSMNSLNIHPGQLTDTRENRLRVLRHDAMENHLAESAIFFAEKVMAITDGTLCEMIFHGVVAEHAQAILARRRRVWYFEMIESLARAELNDGDWSRPNNGESAAKGDWNTPRDDGDASRL